MAGRQGSANVHLLSHIPLSGVSDIEVEHELSRPYAYVSSGGKGGFYIISIKDPSKASVLYTWHIENTELHQGSALGPVTLKSKGRYYFVQSFQYLRTGPDLDLGAVVFDVTGLPDTTKVREVARIRTPKSPGGFHEDFAYKHSDGRALYLATSVSPHALIYDIDKVAAGGDPESWIVGRVPVPEGATRGVDTMLVRFQPSYHDFYVGYDPVSHQDRFYGAGSGGYYVYDITNVTEPKLLASVSGVAGVTWGHTFTPDPTGRYVVSEAEYTYAPLRLFDLKPALDGQIKTISRPIGAWTASWKGLPHNHEVRWPYVFVSTYADEFYVFNMMDPSNPYTVGYYDTAPGVDLRSGSTFGVDVRNADGLIVTSDMRQGFFAFKLDGFDGWNGHQWGLPNVSSAQDWDNGPDGAPKAGRVS
ncbi:MAG: hypothetical protein HY700_12425 [Gemmatimonadetes bacterium]|nr:hypothetical protein [Gemmatimonadota bacterium]